MNTHRLVLTLAAVIGVGACDNGTGPGPGTPQIPAVPELGPQIDRLGRPAINTALNNTFNPDTTATAAAKDAYNNASFENWTSFVPEVSKNLAVLDSLDGVCGNQLLAAAALNADRYLALGNVLADDALYVNTASTTCTQYLAVEANFLGIANNDCGGRAPPYDVIDVTYSVLATGNLSGVTDGVTADGDGPIHDFSTFPFIAGPPGVAQ